MRRSRVGRRQFRTRRGLAAFALSALQTVVAAAPGSASVGDGRAALARELAIERARPAAPRLERDRFEARSPVVDARLAPDGSRVAWLRSGAAGTLPELWTIDVASGRETKLLPRADAERLAWSRDGRVLFVAIEGKLLRIDADTPGRAAVVAPLGGAERRAFLDVDPTQEAAALVVESPTDVPESSTRVVRVAADGTRSELLSGVLPIADVALTADGGVAFARIRDGASYRIVTVSGGRTGGDVARCERLVPCAFASAATTTAADARAGVWLRGGLAHDLAGLERLASDGSVTTLARDPEGLADVAAVDLDAATARPRFVRWRSAGPAIAAVEAGDRVPLDALRRAFPGEELRIQAAAARPWLVERRSDRMQVPRWVLFDPATRATRPIFEAETREATRLAPEAAARKIFFRYRASDGRSIPAFLTVPPGRDPARLALVAKVHGGPWNQVGPGFDSTTQLLAARGAAVFEPDFRASSGFGRGHLFAADGDFGDGRVQRDVDDGVRFLLAAGVGGRSRVAIVGASFGGYSALLGATASPELYRAAAAFVPPTDFAWAVRFMAERDRPRGAEMPLALTLPMLGLDPADRERMESLAAASPRARAAELSRPLLVVAGGEDDRVALRSVVDYAAHLRALGRDVSFYVAPDEGHRTGDARERDTGRALLEAFLARHVGTDVATPYDDADGRLARQLRLDGSELRRAVTASR